MRKNWLLFQKQTVVIISNTNLTLIFFKKYSNHEPDEYAAEV